MNILYITNLSGNLFAGPNNSVPAQIDAQKKYDNVFWLNMNHIRRDEWKTIGCKTIDDYPTGRLKDLPIPFSNPDLVVVEEFYCHPFSKIIKDIQRKKIPYIIIPRSELTQNAQRKKKLKKVIGNFVYFNRLAKNAIAIHYLSNQEQSESYIQWENDSFVIPNGTNKKKIIKNHIPKDSIDAVYIGRYEKYQKGLDLLMKTIIILQDELREAGFNLSMYGVDQEGTITEIKKEIEENCITDIVTINEPVFGREKERILLNSDVFVMTSRFEGMPMGLIEALSYGLPCLITRGTNMFEEVNYKSAGWVAETDINSIVCAFRNCIQSKELFGKMGKNAIELSNCYTWDSIAKESHHKYYELLNFEIEDL